MTSGWLSSSSSLFFSEIVGENVTVGDGVVGAALGAGTGMDDGARVVGAGIGPDDGTGVVGAWVGTGTGIFVGADAMSRSANVPSYIAQVMVASALLTMVTAMMLMRYRIRWR